MRKFKIKMGRLNHIFISHIHGDHTFGLFGLLSSFNLMGRNYPLHIYAPGELENILQVHFRMFGIELQNPLIFHPVDCTLSQEVFEDEKVLVKSFPLRHRVPTCGYSFKEKSKRRHLVKEKIEEYKIPIAYRTGITMGRDYQTPEGLIIPNAELTRAPELPKSFAYCTDTLYNRGILGNIRNADLLFHEATFLDEDARRAKDTYHSTALQAARIAKEAGVKKLILGHFSARYKVLEPLLEEARSVFENTELAGDGKTFIV